MSSSAGLPSHKPPRTVTVLHLIATNFCGGPERQIIEHVRRLDRERFSGLVATFVEGNQSNGFIEQAQRARIPAFPLSVRHAYDPAALKKLKRLLEGSKAEILCTHGYRSTILGWLVARRTSIHTLAFSRGYTSENLKVSLFEALERRILPRVNGVVSVSHGQSRRLAELGVKPRRQWVVHNAVLPVPPPGDADELRRDVFSRLGIQQDRLLIVSAGRLSPEKGYGDLLRAIALMGPTASKCAFVVCGDGSLAPQLTKMARDLDLSKLVQFCGFRSDILEIFQAMDLFVLPSLTEGFPNVLLEAFACGKPAVATSVGGVPELVCHGENGILVPPSRPDLLGKAVADYVDSPNRRLTSGHAALRAVTSRFTFEKQTARLQAVYCELLSDSESSAIPTLSDDVSGSASTVL